MGNGSIDLSLGLPFFKKKKKNTPGNLKNFDSIHREGISIYVRAFKQSAVEALVVEATNSS